MPRRVFSLPKLKTRSTHQLSTPKLPTHEASQGHTSAVSCVYPSGADHPTRVFHLLRTRESRSSLNQAPPTEAKGGEHSTQHFHDEISAAHAILPRTNGEPRRPSSQDLERACSTQDSSPRHKTSAINAKGKSASPEAEHHVSELRATRVDRRPVRSQTRIPSLHLSTGEQRHHTS